MMKIHEQYSIFDLRLPNPERRDLLRFLAGWLATAAVGGSLFPKKAAAGPAAAQEPGRNRAFRKVPPLDRVVPVRLETASFAMG